MENEQDVSDSKVLAAAAAKIGMDQAEVIAMLKTNQFKAEVNEDLKRAKEKKMDGVPQYVVAGMVIDGCQKVEVWTQVFKSALKA